MSWTFTKKRRVDSSSEVPRLSFATLRRNQFKTTVPSIVGEYQKVLMTSPVVGRLTDRNRRDEVKKKRKKHIGARLYPSLAFNEGTKIIVTPSYAERRRTFSSIKKMSKPRLGSSHGGSPSRSEENSRIHSPSLSPCASSSNIRSRYGSRTSVSRGSRRQSRNFQSTGSPSRPASRGNRSKRDSPVSSRPNSRQYTPNSRPSSSHFSRPGSSYKRIRKRRRKKKKQTFTPIPSKSSVLVIDKKEEQEKNDDEEFQYKMELKMIPERPTDFVKRKRKPMSRILSTKPLERLPFTEQSPFVIRDNVIQQLKNHVDRPNLWARGLLTNNLESGFYEPLGVKEDFQKRILSYEEQEKNKNKSKEIPKREYDLSFGSSALYANLKRPKTVPIKLRGDPSRLNFQKRRKWRDIIDDDSDSTITNNSGDTKRPFSASSSSTLYHRLFRDRVKVEKILSPEEKRRQRSFLRASGRRGRGGLYNNNKNKNKMVEELEIDVTQTLSDRDLELEISRIFAGNSALKGSSTTSSSSSSPPSQRSPSPVVPFGRGRDELKRNHIDPNYYLEKLKKEFDLMGV